MVFKKLEVPTSSITEVKRSPMEVFDIARKEETGVYIFNREKVAGVMLTKELYEKLVGELETLKGDDSEQQPRNNRLDLQEELKEAVKEALIKETKIALQQMEDLLVGFGFTSKRTSDGNLDELQKELSETGKVVYRSWKWQHLNVEIVGEVDPNAQQLEKIIIKKVYFTED